ncbi:nucleotide exchange factor GrpE [Deferribacterales bacterium RsTz2092]|nr:protein GrpE [Deferribacterales bacterium]
MANEERLDITVDDDVSVPKPDEAEADVEVAEETAEVSVDAKLKDENDKLLRYVAEMENRMKRVVKETDDKIKYANQSLITKLLPTLDNIELTLQHGETATVESLLEGVKLSQKALLGELEKVGLKLLVPDVGVAFDPNEHEALMLVNNAELADNSIASVLQTGYSLNGRLVRPAKVQVNKIN